MAAMGATSSSDSEAPSSGPDGLSKHAATRAPQPSTWRNSAGASRQPTRDARSLLRRGGGTGRWDALPASCARRARASQMKLSTPLGCQVESPRSRELLNNAAGCSSSSSPGSRLPVLRGGDWNTNFLLSGSCLPRGVRPVCKESKNLCDEGEASKLAPKSGACTASWPLARLASCRDFCCGVPGAGPPSAALFASRALPNVDGAATSTDAQGWEAPGAELALAAPLATGKRRSLLAPKLAACRWFRNCCALRGPSRCAMAFNDTGWEPTSKPWLVARKGAHFLLFAGGDCAGPCPAPNALDRHSSGSLPTNIATWRQ